MRLGLCIVAVIVVMGLGAALGQGLGTVAGTVRVARAPAARTLPVSQQQETCGATQPDESVVVGRGGALAGVVVWLEGVAAPAGARPGQITLNQRRCRFEPHVQTATAGATLVLTSNDPVLHNVHSFVDGDRTLFNLALPVQGMSVRRVLAEPGRIRFKCDAGHTWMSAHIHVFPHPFHAVSGRDGTFRIPAVPPGTYPVRAWHERLGEKRATATVAADGTAQVAIQY